MGKRRKRSGNLKGQRIANARETQNSLIHLLDNTEPKDSTLARSSARQILALSRKHRLSLPSKAKTLLCRKCETPFSHGSNVRTRIKNGLKIVTCLKCQNIRRYSVKIN